MTGAWCVWLVARANVWNWPVGIANNVFFLIIFLAAGLYADGVLQIVYMGLAAYGWWAWLHGGDTGHELPVSRVTPRQWIVLAGTGVVGTLVVAGNATALAARDGAFTLFNVASGSAEIRGYKAGLQLTPATAAVRAGATTDGVELVASSAALASVSGDVSFVNASANVTSVVLVVKSTFNSALARGEVPVGLRQSQVSGHYSFEGVPAGTYTIAVVHPKMGRREVPIIVAPQVTSTATLAFKYRPSP